MTELYKIFAGKYDNNTTEWMTGKCLKNYMIQKIIDLHCIATPVHYDMRKFRSRSELKMFDTIGKPT